MIVGQAHHQESHSLGIVVPPVRVGDIISVPWKKPQIQPLYPHQYQCCAAIEIFLQEKQRPFLHY